MLNVDFEWKYYDVDKFYAAQLAFHIVNLWNENFQVKYTSAKDLRKSVRSYIF